MDQPTDRRATRTLVTGASGTFGQRVVRGLTAGGHDVVAASRRATVPADAPGPGTVTGLRMDLADGTGLDDLAGVDVVVHLASDPRGTAAVDDRGTARLVEAARRAGVRHLVAISIVGIDDHPWPYYRAKLAMEEHVTGSGVPWTILRATQFHGLLGRFLDELPPVVPVPRGVRLQPIDEGVVADRVVELALGEPLGRAPDLGGPEVHELSTMVRELLAARGDRALLLPVPMGGRWATAFRDGRMLVDERTPGPTWAEHLATVRGERVAA